MQKEALFYTKLPNKAVVCQLCPHNCKINNNCSGLCKVRKNLNGVLFSQNYSLISAMALDPIEKKPLYDFYPGEEIFSLGSLGCNMGCLHCQNHHISQCFKLDDPRWQKLSVRDLLYLISEKGFKLVAFTYNEPIVWYEYLLEILPHLKKRGIKTVLVSNGYINPQPLQKLLPYIDAVSLDIKWGLLSTAKKLSQITKPQVVYQNAQAISKAGIHLELVTNLVDGYNDSEIELTHIAKFIKQKLPANTPWHISRAFPYYKLQDIAATPLAKLTLAQNIAKANNLKVYLGNI